MTRTGKTRAWRVALALVALILGVFSMPVRPASASGPPHIMVIVEENAAYNKALGTPYIIGNPNAPYLNGLATQYASATNWYSVEHISYKDYADLISGSDQSCCTKPYAAATLVDQLASGGYRWKAYIESLPSACYNGASTGDYDKGHNPFAVFQSTRTAPQCNNVVPYDSTQMSTDLNSSQAPDFVWITPNLCHDMHTKCTTASRVAEGDAWLKSNLPTVLASSWYTGGNGIVIITWDESVTADTSGVPNSGDSGGHVATIVISANSTGAFTGLGDHFGTLRAIENSYGVACLLNACNAVHGDLSPAF